MDTNFTNLYQLLKVLKFVTIRVIRVFTAAFPRRVFGKRDRRAKGPRTERPPVIAAKFFECLLCRRRFALSLEHHAPVCGCKRPAVMSISADRGL